MNQFTPQRLLPKIHLGDGVYAYVNPARQVVLTIEDGGKTHDTIYLEPEVWRQLVFYMNEACKPENP